MNQILIIAGIIGILLFLRWVRKQPQKKQIQSVLILVAIVLILLAITGRLNPLFAVIAAAVASLQKFAGLLRFLPFFKNLFTNNPSQASDSSNQTDPANLNNKMTEEEALKILGISKNATVDEIIEAHRKLIQKLHPDRGGNDFLASKINQAKDYLLDRVA